MIRLFFGIDLHLVHGLKTVSPVDILKAFAVGLLTFVEIKKVQCPVLITLKGRDLCTFGFRRGRGLGSAGAERNCNAQ